MKFLEKIEDAINEILEKVGTKLFTAIKALIPQSFVDFKHKALAQIPIFIDWIKHVPGRISASVKNILGIIAHYIHLLKGNIHAQILYIKSDDFKARNKLDYLLTPFKKYKTSLFQFPIKTLSITFAVVFTFVGVKMITSETNSIYIGIKKLRAPASEAIVVEEDVRLEVGSFQLSHNSHGDHGSDHGSAHADNSHGTPAEAHGAPADAHGAPAKEDHGAKKPEAHEPPPPKEAHGGAPASAHGSSTKAQSGQNVIVGSDITLKGPELEAQSFKAKDFEEITTIPIDVAIIFSNSKDKITVEKNHELIHEISHAIEHHGIPGGISLPLDTNKKTQIAQYFEANLKKDPKVKDLYKYSFNWEINQDEVKKPKYHLALQRQYRIENISLQLLLEEVKRNKQVYFDFVIQTNNREGVKILEHHKIEIRDHLMMNVEPVVPGLPLDSEGKQIIRDKVKFEINEYLKHHGFESEVEEVFIDYILAS